MKFSIYRKMRQDAKKKSYEQRVLEAAKAEIAATAVSPSSVTL